MITAEADVHSRYCSVQRGQREWDKSYRAHVYVYICVPVGLFLYCENYTVWSTMWPSLHNPNAKECGRFVAPVK